MKIITQPTVEPVTVADVKQQLGITDTASDVLIARRITQARQWAESYTARSFITQTLEIRRDCFYETIELEAPPAVSIVSVKYINEAGVLTPVTITDYVLDDYPLVPFIRTAYGISWPTPRSEKNAVRIQYVAGYGADGTSVPTLIREAIILIIGNWTNFQPQAENGVFMSRVPNAAKQILDIYAITRL